MTKHWWNVNRQSTIDEYDETPKKKWFPKMTAGDYLRMGIPLVIYCVVVFYIFPTWDPIYRLPLAALCYFVSYFILLIGWEILKVFFTQWKANYSSNKRE